MVNMFSYEFMRRAFLVAALIAFIAPCIGLNIVLKRLSSVGDAASHSALAGIAFGLAAGINPVLGAVIFSVLAVLMIELLRRRFKKYPEVAAVTVMSAGIGLTAVLSGFIKDGSSNLNSFMFGSIVAVSDFELFLTMGLGAAVLVVSLLLYKELFYITFDEEAASLAGVPVKSVNFILMLLTAVTVSAASRVVGALMISSLIVIPAAAAVMISKSYKCTLITSVILAEISAFLGLTLSFYLDLRPGGTIVLTSVAMLVVIMIISKRRRL